MEVFLKVYLLYLYSVIKYKWYLILYFYLLLVFLKEVRKCIKLILFFI